jgi:hypothetical protein
MKSRSVVGFIGNLPSQTADGVTHRFILNVTGQSVLRNEQSVGIGHTEELLGEEDEFFNCCNSFGSNYCCCYQIDG